MKNIIFLISDQMQRKSVLVDPRRIMPNVERLRKDSVDFYNMHTVNAICSPARASMLTGMLPHNHGMVDCTHTVPPYRADFNDKLQTLPQIFKSNGYSICYHGKWHVERSYKLENFGIDEYETEHEIPSTHLTSAKRITVSTPGYRTSTIAGVYKEDDTASEEYYIYNRAMDFIRKHHRTGKQPFCAFISTYAPHDPYVVPQNVYDMYKDTAFPVPVEWNSGYDGKPSVYKRLHDVWACLSDDEISDVIRCYYSSCTLVDLQIGRLLDFLKAEGLYDDTIIVFTSDHGDMAGAHGLFCKGVPSFENIYSIPLLIKPAGHIDCNSCDVYADTCDILPTIAEMAGLDWNCKVDGKSLVPYINGQPSVGSFSMAEFFGQRFSYTQRIVWCDGYKYVFNAFDTDELYDLKNDPDENVNLAYKPYYSPIKERLCSLMWKRVAETNDWSLGEAQYFMHRIAPFGPGADCKLSQKFSMFNKVF